MRNISFTRLLTATRVLRGLARLVFGGFLVISFSSAAYPQANPLNLFQNYFVTGDYVVGGVGLRGTGDATGLTNGSITIAGVPSGAQVIGAYLYWQTVESGQTAFAGQKGYFNGYPITGTLLGNPNTPTSWSSGGCSGSSKGSKTIRTYRMDVSPYLSRDLTGNVLGPYQVRLADSGSNGGGAPLTLGATLVLVYRVLSPAMPMPLRSVVLYDGSFSPSNSSETMSQSMVGFYQASQTTAPVAKITHIVGNGQSNKTEQLIFNNVEISANAFPGTLNQSWDNPTFDVSADVPLGDVNPVMMEVIPAATNSGCVTWGAVVFSTTVQDTDGDGLLDVWETNQGYTDVNTNQFVALPGANVNEKDIFIEVDYLRNLAADSGPGSFAYLHSHLPKQKALDLVGDAFLNAPVLNPDKTYGIHVHFDVGNVYQNGDPYIVPFNANIPYGGNAIPEYAVFCSDSGNQLCVFPGQAAVGWEGAYLSIKGSAAVPTNTKIPLGNFQFNGRKDSYHYMLWGHALGLPRSLWSAFNGTLTNNTVPKLVSLVDSGNTATVTIVSPPGFLNPGDCPGKGNPPCNGTNDSRVSVSGALAQTALNGTYFYQITSQSTDGTGVTTTVFKITTSGVPDGTYAYNCPTQDPTCVPEPQLALAYEGAISASGQSTVGGADSMVTFGLWPANDVPNCNADPTLGPPYCDNEVGSVTSQAGTLMHELGHTLALTHGGTTYGDPNNPYVPTYGQNCKSNFQSVMNYMFQVDLLGPKAAVDYSRQALDPLNEASLAVTNLTPAPTYYPTTEWYAPLNGGVGSEATRHCDGTPLLTTDVPTIRVTGPTTAIPWFAGEDINFNGDGTDVLTGFNDWASLDLRQIGATGGNIMSSGLRGSGGLWGCGGFWGSGGLWGSGGVGPGEVTQEIANAVVRPPSGLTASLQLPANQVLLNWTGPIFGQLNNYNIYRGVNGATPTLYDTVSGNPLKTTYTDQKAGCATFTYFITDVLVDGRESIPTNSVSISVPCTFVGFLSPLNTAGTLSAPTFSGVVNQTSAVPIKWELLDFNGNPIGDLSTVSLLSACPTTGKTSPPSGVGCVPLYSPTTGAKGNSTFRFSSPQFIFNWDTISSVGPVPAGAFFTIELQLNDGSAIKASNIQFK